MPVDFDTVGVQSITATLVERVETTRKLDDVVIPDSDSGFGAAEAFNPMIEFSISGKGSTPVAAVVGQAGDATIIPDLISGGVTLITGLKEEESNDDFQSWEVTGLNAPGASAPTP